jgi:hypothetical protein
MATTRYLTPEDVKRLYRPSRPRNGGRATIPGIGVYSVTFDLGGAVVLFRPEGAHPNYFGTVGHTAGHVFAEPGAPATFEELIANRVSCWEAGTRSATSSLAPTSRPRRQR